MPKHVWICDYCLQTEITFDNALEHENKCPFNPINKHCYTCKNRRDVYGSILKCDVNIKREDMYNYEDNGNCPSWKPLI